MPNSSIPSDNSKQDTPGGNQARLVRVALPVPLRRLFDYQVSDELIRSAPDQWIGCRVQVPFGPRKLVGVVLETTEQSDLERARIRNVLQFLDAAPILPAPLIQLANWSTDYYQHPVGEVIQTFLPNRLLRPTPATAQETVYSPQENADAEALLSRTPRQLALYSWLQQRSQASREQIIAAGFSTQLIASLKKKQLLQTQVQDVSEGPVTAQSLSTAQIPITAEADKPELNDEQRESVDAIVAALGEFGTFLLDGVTGSGKTEVYLRAIEAALERGSQCLVLVPEIGLTPQTLSRFQQRFKLPVVSLHSGLTDKARLDSWHQARLGKARIVIGTRSALFTPMPDLGLIVVDEEHDPSFKQQEGFRYSARDLAQKRGRNENALVLLGSATPSLESLHNVNTGKIKKLSLSQRAGGAALARLRLAQVVPQQTQSGLTPESLTSIGEHLARGEQVLVFINRRGFSPVLNCNACGFIENCPNCSSPYTVHSQPQGLRCHHCDSSRALPIRCTQCQSTELQSLGVGTQRLDSFLQSAFPKTQVLRIDRDAVRRKGSLESKLKELERGEPAILVGTQMLAKGHHFPALTLVVIVDADGGLFSADFRGLEFMAQTILQVAGRAGRAATVGDVLIQTQYAEHEFFCRLTEQGYGELADWLLQSRQTAALPPFCSLALLRCEATAPAPALRLLRETQARARALSQAQQLRIEVGEPLIAPVERRAGRFRFQLLFKASQRGELNALLKQLLLELETGRSGNKLRWSIDVDPIDML